MTDAEALEFARVVDVATADDVTRAVAERYRFAVVGKIGRHDQIDFTPIGTDAWRALTDVDVIRLRVEIERAGFKPISHRRMSKAVRFLARL